MNHIDHISKLDSQPLAANECIVNDSDCIPSFGRQLDALLKQKHFRNSKLADRVGVSQNLIAQYRRGTTSCCLERANQLAKALNCTEAQRSALCRAAALTTQDPIGECIQTMLLEHGIQKDSIISVAPSATANQVCITTRDGRVARLTVSVWKV